MSEEIPSVLLILALPPSSNLVPFLNLKLDNRQINVQWTLTKAIVYLIPLDFAGRAAVQDKLGLAEFELYVL